MRPTGLRRLNQSAPPFSLTIKLGPSANAFKHHGTLMMIAGTRDTRSYLGFLVPTSHCFFRARSGGIRSDEFAPFTFNPNNPHSLMEPMPSRVSKQRKALPTLASNLDAVRAKEEIVRSVMEQASRPGLDRLLQPLRRI